MTRSNSLDHAARLRVERTGCTYAQAYEMEELVAEEYEAERCYPDGYDTDRYDEDGPDNDDWIERCLIAAETRDLDHLADLEAANIDPQSRRLREIIARRRSELHLLLTAPPVEGFSPVWGKS